jgi:hypothetical protein
MNAGEKSGLALKREREGRELGRRSPMLARVIRCSVITWLAGGGFLRPDVALADTVALWLFDEQAGVYPSSVLNDGGPGSHFLILGRGAEIVPGRFGNALRPVEPAPLEITFNGNDGGGGVAFGLRPPPAKPGRTQPPLMWANAHFAALATGGDGHLRRAPFPNATDSKLNLGAQDWTLECWLKLNADAAEQGTLFEIGSGPRGENELVTRLTVSPRESAFVLASLTPVSDQNSGMPGRRVEFPNPEGPPGGAAYLQSTTLALNGSTLPRDTWFHVAIVYSRAKSEVSVFVDGRKRGVASLRMMALPRGTEAYVSIGRDGRWQRALPGAIDELRISDRAVYANDFPPPASFSRLLNGARPSVAAARGPAPLFPGGRNAAPVVELGGRRHLFLDDALIARQENITFNAHPVRVAERVVQGSGWISVVDAGPEDIRLYLNGPENSLAVLVSKDGVNFSAPDLGRGVFRGQKNIVITDPATVGTVFLDRNGPPEERWKAVSGLRNRGGIFVYTSADGLAWRRNEATALPFWAGSALNVFYDDQRQRYVIHNRSDYYRTQGGTTDRKSLLTEVTDLLQPWPFAPVSAAMTRAAAARGVRTRAGDLDPWWLDNGPLAPGGFGLEYPIAFEADPAVDPVGTDVYNTRAQKYPWADDTYVAFPLFFFHYHRDGPMTRQVLAHPAEERGTGLVETQLAVSRDGLKWTRYPRPTYLGIGDEDGYPVRRSYIGYGLVRRGTQIWQYSYTRSTYHDPYVKKAPAPDTIHRLVQRVDGFVSADAPYTGGSFTTKPLRFAGNRLLVNVDTDAAGYAQIGLLDERGAAIPGFSVDDCVYVNGDAIDYEVEWLGRNGATTKDVSSLAGRTVQVVVRMRGTSLYALQFAAR